MLKILKEAAELAPVPFLKGAIGTTLALLETARVGFLSPFWRTVGQIVNQATFLDNSVKP
jgi:hypothetical protein